MRPQIFEPGDAGFKRVKITPLRVQNPRRDDLAPESLVVALKPFDSLEQKRKLYLEPFGGALVGHSDK